SGARDSRLSGEPSARPPVRRAKTWWFAYRSLRIPPFAGTAFETILEADEAVRHEKQGADDDRAVEDILIGTEAQQPLRGERQDRCADDGAGEMAFAADLDIGEGEDRDEIGEVRRRDHIAGEGV